LAGAATYSRSQVALQNLLWGAVQPFAGAVADRYGTIRSLWVGAILYAAGLVLMAYSTTPGMLTLSAGVLIGSASPGASFTIVLAAFGKLLPQEWRSICFRRGHRSRIVRPVLFSPLAVALLHNVGGGITR
jgi:MFS family permease